MKNVSVRSVVDIHEIIIDVKEIDDDLIIFVKYVTNSFSSDVVRSEMIMSKQDFKTIVGD